MFKIRKLALLSVAVAGLGIAGCTQADENAFISGLQANCTNAVSGSTMVISIVSSLSGLQPVAVLSNNIGANAAPICANIVAQAQTIVDDITALGGTATVSVSTAPTASLKGGRLLSKFKVSPGVIPGTKSITYIVGPNPFAKL